MSRNIAQFALVLLTLFACTPVRPVLDEPVVVSPDTISGPEPSPIVQGPTPPVLSKDAGLSRAPAYVQSAELFSLESYPVRVVLKLRGNLPTPCHQLRTEVKPADEENRIIVDVYSVANPEEICVQVLADFEVDLDLGSFAGGHYSVWVNGKKIGEFDA